MSRALLSLLLASTSMLLPGCRPSKAEFEAMQAQLDGIRAQQEEIDRELRTLTEVESAGDFDRSAIEHDLDGVMARVEQLERALVQLEEPRANKRRGPPPGRPDPKAVYRVELGDAPVRGPSDALVTIVMWTDYQCPYCVRVQATMAQLEEEYGRSVRFVHKHNPLGFHPRAMPAALAAEAAHRQGKFWRMHDRIFENPKQLTDANLRTWAKKLGLKVKRFNRDMKDPELRERVERDQSQGIELGARGTPAFFINGRFLSGAQPVENFRALIDEELSKARRVMDERGLAPDEVYEATIERGKTKV